MYQTKITKQVKRKKKSRHRTSEGDDDLFRRAVCADGDRTVQRIYAVRFLLVLLYFIFDTFSKKEYEYVLEGTTLSISVIWGGHYRREHHALDLEIWKSQRPTGMKAWAKYRAKGGTVKVHKYDYTSYDDNVPYYTHDHFVEGRRKIKLLLDLDEEMLDAIRRICPGKVIVA